MAGSLDDFAGFKICNVWKNFQFSLTSVRRNMQYKFSVGLPLLAVRIHAEGFAVFSREHLGLEMGDSTDVSDPICPDFYKNIWLKQASINTTIYEKVCCFMLQHKITGFFCWFRLQLGIILFVSGLLLSCWVYMWRADVLLRRVFKWYDLNCV